MKTGLTLGVLAVLGLALVSQTPARVAAAAPEVPDTVTYSKDIAPIIQRSCENCHRVDGVAPMALSTYEEVRPWARAIKQRTSIGPKAGVMQHAAGRMSSSQQNSASTRRPRKN